MRLYEMDYGAYKPCPTELKVESQKISFFHPFIRGEKKSVKTFLVRILFYVQSKGNFRIYYVRGEEENLPSIKGIEAAGLRQVGSVERQGLRKIYRRV